MLEGPVGLEALVFWANGSFDKKRGRHDNERTELRLRDLGKIWVLALAPRKPIGSRPLQAAVSTLRLVCLSCCQQREDTFGRSECLTLTSSTNV